MISAVVLAAVLVSQAGEANALGSVFIAQNEAAALKDGDPSRARLAIMSVAPSGVPEEYAVGITETIATEIARTGVFDTISPKQIQSILAYEKRRDALGGCVNEDCFVQVARLVKAEKLIGGSVAKVGETLVLNLILIDAVDGKAINRSKKETTNASELVNDAYRSAIVLLQPLLNARRGYLRVDSNVADAAVYVDEERRAEGPNQVIALPAGPHTIRVSQDGFYAASADVLVKPGVIETTKVALIPAKETIESYESKASFMRTSAYVTGALAIGSVVAAAVFYGQASDDKAFVDGFAAASDVQKAAPGYREEALERSDSFSINQGLYLGGLLGGLIFGGASAYFFLAGDDPDRYEEFRSLR